MPACSTDHNVSRTLQFAWMKGALDSATVMHQGLLQAILRAPMGFFYKTPTGDLSFALVSWLVLSCPTGRIINRFSRDIGGIDQQ